MARRGNNGAGPGCLLLIGLTVGLPIVLFPVVVAALVMAAPAIVPYLLITDPALLERSSQWWVALAASPVLALALVWGANRNTGRAPLLTKLRMHIVRAVALLAATTLTSAALLKRGTGITGSRAEATETDVVVRSLPFAVVAGSTVAMLIVLIAIRVLGRNPSERIEPVDVETVRKATVKADETLRRVRAENQRVSRLAKKIEAKFAEARPETDFATLHNMHRESFGCANQAHRHYESAGISLRTLSRILAGVRVALRPRIVPARNSAGRRERPDRYEMNTSAAALSESRQQLHAEVQRGLSLVQTLNAQTARLKHSIRDNCGEDGLRWYEALELRNEGLRANPQRSRGFRAVNS